MRLVKLLILSFFLISTPSLAETSIDGVWKHTDKPAWFEMRFDSGIGTLDVVRHDNNARAKGLNVIKGIILSRSKVSQWDGKMYSAEKNGYVAVQLILTDPITINVYLIDDKEKLKDVLRLTRV